MIEVAAFKERWLVRRELGMPLIIYRIHRLHQNPSGLAPGGAATILAVSPSPSGSTRLSGKVRAVAAAHLIEG